MRHNDDHAPVGRPRGTLGEVSTKVLLVVKDLVESGDHVDGVTWREVFNKACMSRRMVKDTMDNLARAGHIVKSGERAMKGAYKPLRVFVPAQQPALLGAAGREDVLGIAMFRFCGPVPQAANDGNCAEVTAS